MTEELEEESDLKFKESHKILTKSLTHLGIREAERTHDVV